MSSSLLNDSKQKKPDFSGFKIFKKVLNYSETTSNLNSCLTPLYKLASAS